MSSRKQLIAGLLLLIVLAAGAYFYLYGSGQPPASGENSTLQGAGGNLLWPSADFTAANWNRVHITVQPAPGAAPGGKDAARLIETAENGHHYIYYQLGGIEPGKDYTFSIYVKPAGRSFVQLEVRDDPQKRYGTLTCNLAQGGQTTPYGDVDAHGMDSPDNGWQRCWLAMSFDHAPVDLAVKLFNAAGSLDYSGDGASGLFVWGAQFEPGKSPSAYSPTTTGPASAAK